MNDLMVLAGIAVALGLGLWGAMKNTSIYFRIGSVVTALAVCDGCAYFGWRPYFGGTNHDAGTYFGCIMLTSGVVGWLLFRGISDATPTNRNPPA